MAFSNFDRVLMHYKPYNIDDLLPWSIFEKLKYGSSVPILGTHPLRPTSIVAWHTTAYGQNFHTVKYRLKKSLCKNDMKEFSIALSETDDLDQPISNYDKIPMISLASKFNHYLMVKMLIFKGAKLNIQDKYGLTPLAHAVKNENFECVKLLAENGADIMIEDNFGISPLKLAKVKKLKAISHYLETILKDKKAVEMLRFNVKNDFIKDIDTKIEIIEKLKIKLIAKPNVYPFNDLKGTYLVSFSGYE